VTFRRRAVDADAVAEPDEDTPQPGPRPGPRSPRVHGRGLPRRAVTPPADEGDRGDPGFSSTLPLADGGFVVALGRQLANLDAEGALRSRASTASPLAAPLVAVGQEVAIVSARGEVFTWDLRGSPDSVRSRGFFGGRVDGAAAAIDDRHLLAVIDGARLVSLDLTTGHADARATATTGAFAGSFALEPSTGTALVQNVSPTGTTVLAIDQNGRSTPLQLLLSRRGTAIVADAGSAWDLAPTHTELVVDPTGNVAYATVDGHVGVASATMKVELGVTPCGAAGTASPANARRPHSSAGFAGLVPAGPYALAIACESGKLSFIRGDAD
jgi:hypothetical protein